MSELLSRVKRRYQECVARIGSSNALRTTAQHDGSAHVEVNAGELSYVVTERGLELERRRTRSEDELLYWIISDEVFDLACSYELEHRRTGQDTRRLMFQRELELLHDLSPAWADRKRAEIEAILSRHPYRDAG